MTHNGVIREGRIELDKPLALPEGQRVRVSVEAVDATASTSPPASPKRLLDAMRSTPPVSDEDVAALLDAIKSGKLPPSNAHPFEDAA